MNDMLCMSSSLVRPWHRVGIDSLFTVISSFHPTLRGLCYSLAHSLGIDFGYCDSFYFLKNIRALDSEDISETDTWQVP